MRHGTIAKLARITGKPYSTVYFWITARRTIRDVATARTLAELTGSGTDQETLAWMSGDVKKIGKMFRKWEGDKS